MLLDNHDTASCERRFGRDLGEEEGMYWEKTEKRVITGIGLV